MRVIETESFQNGIKYATKISLEDGSLRRILIEKDGIVISWEEYKELENGKLVLTENALFDDKDYIIGIVFGSIKYGNYNGKLECTRDSVMTNYINEFGENTKINGNDPEVVQHWVNKLGIDSESILNIFIRK